MPQRTGNPAYIGLGKATDTGKGFENHILLCKQASGVIITSLQS